MDIHFNFVKPKPLNVPQNSIQLANNIWGNNITFKSAKQYKIIAPSGTGKSTFTHILAGIRHDYDGDILIHQRPLKGFSTKDWEKLRNDEMSFVYQSLKLFPQLTVEENLQLKSEWCEKFQSTRMIEYAKLMGISPYLKTKASKLSYGQCQRIAIIRAICQPFKWIILDEPFSHLDSENRDIAWSLIRKTADENNAGIILCLLDNLEQIQTHFTLNLTNNIPT